MRRGAARGHQRGAYAHRRSGRLLQLVQGHQQRLERPVWQGLRGFVLLVLLKGVQSVRLVHTLGLVAKQDRVTVKRNPHFMRMRRAGVRRLWIHLRGGHTGTQGSAHIAQMRA